MGGLARGSAPGPPLKGTPLENSRRKRGLLLLAWPFLLAFTNGGKGTALASLLPLFCLSSCLCDWNWPFSFQLQTRIGERHGLAFCPAFAIGNVGCEHGLARGPAPEPPLKGTPLENPRRERGPLPRSLPVQRPQDVLWFAWLVFPFPLAFTPQELGSKPVFSCRNRVYYV